MGNLITDDDLQRFALNEKRSKKMGLWVTLIFHLVILIVLLIFSIGTIARGEVSFVTDTNKVLAKKEVERIEQIKDIAHQELENQLAGRRTPVRNIPVNNQTLKDDRHANPEQIYKDAEELQKRIEEAAKLDPGEEAVASPAPEKKQEKKSAAPAAYKGPSVLNWSLDGRRALYLPIPVYKCKGGGDVTVRIVVGRNGYVKSAQVVENSSVADQCIMAAALSAARRSRFSASDAAPDGQSGEIVYRFIAQ